MCGKKPWKGIKRRVWEGGWWASVDVVLDIMRERLVGIGMAWHGVVCMSMDML